MPINTGLATPPPRIGKMGPYTVFVTPPPTPSPRANPESEARSETESIELPVQVQVNSPPPVMAPPAQFYKEKPSSLGFFWDTVTKVQNAHASLDETVARWFGLDQSKYQWALNDYYESNEKAKSLAKQNKLENV